MPVYLLAQGQPGALLSGDAGLSRRGLSVTFLPPLAAARSERSGEAAGCCWFLVAQPALLFMPQVGAISARDKELAVPLPPPPDYCPWNSFFFPFFLAQRGLLCSLSTFFMMWQVLKKLRLGNTRIYQLVFCPKVPASPKSFTQPSSRVLIQPLGKAPG